MGYVSCQDDSDDRRNDDVHRAGPPVPVQRAAIRLPAPVQRAAVRQPAVPAQRGGRRPKPETNRSAVVDADMSRELTRLRKENTRLRQANLGLTSEVSTLKAQVGGLRERCRRIEQRAGSRAAGAGTPSEPGSPARKPAAVRVAVVQQRTSKGRRRGASGGHRTA